MTANLLFIGIYVTTIALNSVAIWYNLKAIRIYKGK